MKKDPVRVAERKVRAQGNGRCCCCFTGAKEGKMIMGTGGFADLRQAVEGIPFRQLLLSFRRKQDH